MEQGPERVKDEEGTSKRVSISVVGCKNQHKSFNLLPPSEEVKSQGINFIFNGNVQSVFRSQLNTESSNFDAANWFCFGVLTPLQFS